MKHHDCLTNDLTKNEQILQGLWVIVTTSAIIKLVVVFWSVLFIAKGNASECVALACVVEMKNLK